MILKRIFVAASLLFTLVPGQRHTHTVVPSVPEVPENKHKNNKSFVSNAETGDDGGRVSFPGPESTLGEHRTLVDIDGEWQQVGPDIVDPSEEQTSYSVTMSENGRILAVGDISNSFSGVGQARVYRQNGSSWERMGENIDGDNVGDWLGGSLSLSKNGMRLAVGAPNPHRPREAGYSRVFEWNGSKWVQMGKDIDGVKPGGAFGLSTSLSDDGRRLAIGSHGEGAVRVYEWDDKEWVQVGNTIVGPSNFGWGMQMSGDGNRVVVGAHARSLVQVFQWNGSSWNQLGKDINGDNVNDFFGWAVSISRNGDRITTSATGRSPGNYPAYARVFELRRDSSWVQLGDDIPSASGKRFGTSLSMSKNGERLIIGDGYVYLSAYEFNGTSWMPMGDKIQGVDTQWIWDLFMAGNGERFVVRVDRTTWAVRTYEFVDTAKDVLQVDVDIQPYKSYNRIRIKPEPKYKYQTLVVSIRGSDKFRVGSIDVGTIRFGPAQASPILSRIRKKDVDSDGYDELILRYRLHELGLNRGDQEVCLTGKKKDGRSFEGCDILKVKPPKVRN